MNRHITPILAAAAIASQSAAFASDGLQVMNMGDRNTMVRVTDPKKLLILPIEESMPDVKIDLLVNGNVEKTFWARLANNNIDYTVPLDLTPYTEKGDVLLSIHTPADRAYTRATSDMVCWEKMELADSFDTTNREKYRPVYHHTPLYGWMNDPNGMFYKDGVWHLYYQYNPYGSKWQNMTWGHSTSTDLVNWKHEPLAIEPNGLGSVFSGSCVVDHNNTAGFGEDAIIALYTSADASQVQSLAHSQDNGLTFDIFPGNPVLTTRSEARDPNMFWNEKTGEWNLVLAHALDKEMLIFTSPDLKEWTLQSGFGKGYGAQDGVWECPDLLQIPVKGTNQKKWVLICNINPGGPFGGSGTQYFIGDFDGHKFTSDNGPETTLWMDYGKDHYATVSWSNAPDGRTPVIAWMSNWDYANEVPTKQFRSANSVPRDLEIFKTVDGKLRLASIPVPELDAMRKDVKTHTSMSLAGKGSSFELPADGICELGIDYALKGATQLDITLSNSKGESVKMKYNVADDTFSMDRRESGDVSFSHNFPAETTAPAYMKKDRKGTLRLFIDRCSVEAFDSEGHFAMTNLVFPTTPYDTVTISSPDGKGKVTELRVYSL